MIYGEGVRVASVWVKDILQWVPISQVIILQRYFHGGKACIQFKLDEKIQESYIEYKEL